MPALSREDLFQRLLMLDEEANLTFDTAERMHLIIVGGGALVLMELITRGTHDIDVISASRQLEAIMETYDINSRVQTYINNFPYNYEDRIRKLPIQGQLIDFYTASLEDIVIAKLYSYRDSDYADITSPTVLKALDWELLHRLATAEDEAKLNALNERAYRQFLFHFEEFERMFRPCEN